MSENEKRIPVAIVSAATPDYARQAGIFVPSWIRNSGAAEITICPLPDPAKTSRQYCQYMRNEALRTAILSAKARGLRAVFLDIDAWVLGPLDDAFDGVHPLGICRWPNINCGVQFYDTTLDFDFDSFLAETCSEISVALKNYRDGRRVGLREQLVWEDALKKYSPHVAKLDDRKWNLCVGDSKWKAELIAHKDTVRIVHVKGRGQRHQQQWRIETAYKIFGDRIYPDA